MHTSFTDWESGAFLEHYGVRGMKWGERRYQNRDGSLTALGKERYGYNGYRSARGVKRDLNKLAREQAHAVANYEDFYNIHTRKTAKLDKKIRKAEAKGNAEKVGTLNKKKAAVDQKYGTKMRQYDALLKRSEALTNRIIKNAQERGISVGSKIQTRSITTGRDLAKTILGTFAGLSAASAIGFGVAYGSGHYVQGNRYYTRNDGLGTRYYKQRRSKNQLGR